MDDHPYYLRQRSNAFPATSVSTLSVSSLTAPIVSSSTVSGHLVSTVCSLTPPQLPTQYNAQATLCNTLGMRQN